MSFTVLIPARLGSTRLPDKPLADIGGRPMVVHVAERAARSGAAQVVVAADDERTVAACAAHGVRALLTARDHATGSDRLAEACALLGLDGEQIVVNVQGDEPLISPETIEKAVDAILQDDSINIATTCEPIDEAKDVLSPDIVKVVTDENGFALYFSRSPIPFPREGVRHYGTLLAALEIEPLLLATFRKHTGLYVYRRSFLLEYTRWPQSTLERAESLEQLRALECGATIRVIEADSPSIGVDTERDLERVRKIFRNAGY